MKTPRIAITCLALPLAGCGGVLDPKGPVGVSERLVLLDALAIMLAIVVPTLIAIFAFAWWFRASNPHARYRPDFAFSGALELMVWAVPALVVTFLGGIAWFGSHALDPYAPLEAKDAPVEIEVISLDWKWLFIYPADHIATVNQIVIPVGRPIHFRLTSSGVMNSFFVPQLGGQIYTMAAMTSQLNLQADEAGSYAGLSAQFSGDGFADMGFKVEAVPASAYAAWVETTRSAGPPLDAAAYAALVKPSRAAPPSTFNQAPPGLFESIASGSSPSAPEAGGSEGPDAPAKKGL